MFQMTKKHVSHDRYATCECGDLWWPDLDLTLACHRPLGLPAPFFCAIKDNSEQLKPITSLASSLYRRGGKPDFRPLTSAWPDPWPRFSKIMHALVSSRWELSIAVCRLSLRFVVLEISGGGPLPPPPNRARSRPDPNRARVKTLLYCGLNGLRENPSHSQWFKTFEAWIGTVLLPTQHTEVASNLLLPPSRLCNQTFIF